MMRVSIQEICKFTNATPQSKNFTGGENIINQGHLLNCGTVKEGNSDSLQIIAFCLQSSSIRDNPHEINGEVLKNGKIVGMRCSCKAGLGAACKHVVATLFYLNRNELESLQVISCTDKKCAWNAPKQSALQKYDMNPLLTHSCFSEKIKKSRERKLKLTEKKKLHEIEIESQEVEDQNHVDRDHPISSHNISDVIEQNDDDEEIFRKIMAEDNPSSALAMHIVGRHDPIVELYKNNNETLSAEIVIDLIKNQETSELLSKLEKLDIKSPLKPCCDKVFSYLSRDVHTICTESHELYSVWQKERKFRITASDAYRLYTYRKNKNPDWEKKSIDYFFGASFSNVHTKYGLENEPLAREAYEKMMGVKVIQCGLIVSKTNPWLGCSPDGIVLQDNKPFKVIEIKCPKEGRTNSAEEIVKHIKWLEMKHDQITLKTKHLYYAQVQIIMAIVNVPSTDFLIYSSLEKTVKIIPISFNEKYTEDLLFSLKFIYFNFMIHNICKKTEEQDKDQSKE